MDAEGEAYHGQGLDVNVKDTIWELVAEIAI